MSEGNNKQQELQKPYTQKKQENAQAVAANLYQDQTNKRTFKTYSQDGNFLQKNQDKRNRASHYLKQTQGYKKNSKKEQKHTPKLQKVQKVRQVQALRNIEQFQSLSLKDKTSQQYQDQLSRLKAELKKKDDIIQEKDVIIENIIQEKDVIIEKKDAQIKQKDAVINKYEVKKIKAQQLQKKFTLLKQTFYKLQKYQINSYQQNFKKISDGVFQTTYLTPESFKIQNRIFYSEIKIKLYQIYISVLTNYDQNIQMQYIKVWNSFYVIHYFRILQSQKIMFKLFEFWNQNQENEVREVMLRMSMQNTMSLIKQKYKDLIKTNNINLQTVLDRSFTNLPYLLVKQPLVSYFPKIKAKLLEAIEKIKKSWYVKHILNQFIKARRNYIFQHKIKNNPTFQGQLPTFTFQQVANHIQEIKVYLVEYPSLGTNGLTYSNDSDKKFPIFINLFPFSKHILQSSDKELQKLGQSYTMFVLLHELAHSLIRRLQIVELNQDSIFEDQNIEKVRRKLRGQRVSLSINLKNINEEQAYIKTKIDTGFLFQVFAFGNFCKICKKDDFQSVSNLLSLKKQPFESQIFQTQQNFKNCQLFLLKQWSLQNKNKKINSSNNNKTHKANSIINQTSKQILKSSQQIQKLTKQLQSLKQKQKKKKNKQSQTMKQKMKNFLLIPSQEEQKKQSKEFQINQKQSLELLKKEINIFRQFGERQGYFQGFPQSIRLRVTQNTSFEGMQIGFCKTFLERNKALGQR